MAPPPNSGDANNKNDDDPLGGMDPMAWLESLAARQGAKPEELTTSADLDIPELPPDTVVDEPGYTPGYDTGKPAAKAEPARPEPAKAAPPPPPKPEPVKAEAPQPQPVAQAAEDDPLGGMDPMAWLESLAARQGAKAEELTTAANLEIPVLPPDTVVDEPGYTPGYDTGKPAAKAEPAPAKAAPPPPPEPARVEPPPQPEPAPVMSSEETMAMDPMAWLESLAARQGAKPEELTTAANVDIPVLPPDTVVDEPGYTPGYDTGKPAAKAEPARPEPAKVEPVRAEPVAPPPPPPAPEPARAEQPVSEPVPASADPFGGMDPMAWLESLAARQGAKAEELVTAHNLDIPLPPPDAVIDEPGYVDYDPFGGGAPSRVSEPSRASTPATPPPAPPPPAPTPEPVAAADPLAGVDPLSWLESLSTEQTTDVEDFFGVSATSVEFTTQPEEEPQPAAMSAEEAAELLGLDETAQPVGAQDPLGGVDPLAWLESLAARQGANLEELVTGGTMELPPAPTDQGDEAYSPFAATSQSSSAGMEPESALNWLEELAAEQGAAAAALTQDFGATQARPSEAGGMSNDINEVQAWLEAQARNLEQTRQELEEEPTTEEIAPAEPASELPSWLRESMPTGPSATPSASPALRDDITVPVAPSDLPSWLVSPEAEPVPDFGDDLIKAIRETGTMPAVMQPGTEAVETPPASPAELESLTRPASPDDVDSWAEALDEEYERRQAGDESVPEWYQEALARASTEIPAVPAQEAAAEIEEVEVEFTPAEAAVPDWLQDMAPSQEAAEALPGDIPDWLRTVAPETPAAAPAPVTPASDDWLVQTVEDADLPDWLKPAAPEPAPVPAQQAAPPPPPPAPAPTPAPTPAPARAQAPAPQPQAQAQPAQQPRPAPAPAPRPAPVIRAGGPAGPEHQARLKQARDLVAASQHPSSLEHYQFLIDSSQLLEETRGDLRQLVEKNPSDPRLRRLLGDTHMRLGDLQAALDTYRSALDQL